MGETKVEKITKIQIINCRKLEKSVLNDKVIEVLKSKINRNIKLYKLWSFNSINELDSF